MWNTVAGATSYDVYFGKGTSPALYKSNVTGTSVQVRKLSSRTAYYWRVVAKNGSGSTSSGVWRFTTR